jgi:hypothetical protein
MSVEAAGVFAQIIPVLLLALVLDVGLMPNPALRGRDMLWPRIVLTLIIGSLVLVELMLLFSVANDTPLTGPLVPLVPQVVAINIVVLVLPHLALVWNPKLSDPVRKVREDYRSKDAKRLAKVEREASELRKRLGHRDAEGGE